MADAVGGGIDPFVAFLIATVLTISGVIGTWIWNIRTRSDRRATETKQNQVETQRLAGEVERLAREKGISERSMAKELADQSANVASTVKSDMRDYINQEIKEIVNEFEHKLQLHEQQEQSMFKAADLIMKSLMDKIVETAKIQADAIVKINDAIDYFRKIIYETANKVQRVEKEQDKQKNE